MSRIHSTATTGQWMMHVPFSLLPAAVLMGVLYSPHIWRLLACCVVTALISEALMMYWRKRSIKAAWSDGSALVTGVLLGFCLPWSVPSWLAIIATVSAIWLGKQLYGGLGHNPFNPAMVGYLVVLVSFPETMSQWLVDGVSQATPLTAHQVATQGNIPLNSDFGAWWAISLAYLLGGLWLVYRGIADGILALATLLGIGITSCLVWWLADFSLSPWWQITAWSSLFGAFYITTDPVTASTTYWGRWIYGLGIGVMTVLIRQWGSHADGLAFAVLLMNSLVPWLDHFTARWSRQHV